MTNTVQFSKKYYVFLLVFLGMLSAFGPFVTDMYLPTLPSMARIFHTTPSLVQMGLATSMLGLALGQVFFGPLSDKYGRRSVLMAAMVVFAVSTVVSIYSPTIEFFNVCRFVQGLGGGGGLVAGAVGWKGIFWILFAIGVVLAGMCVVFRESLPRERRHTGSVFSLMAAFPQLVRMPYFRVYVLMFGFANGVLFAYISSASFIIQNYFHFSELAFAVIFGINALGIGIGSALALKFKKITDAAVFGAAGVALFSVLQLVCYVLFDAFATYEVLTFGLLVSVGYIFTSATTLAMDEGRGLPFRRHSVAARGHGQHHEHHAGDYRRVLVCRIGLRRRGAPPRLAVLAEQPLTHGLHLVGVVEGVHVFAAPAVGRKHAAGSELDDVDRRVLGEHAVGELVLLAFGQLGAPFGKGVFHAVLVGGFLKRLQAGVGFAFVAGNEVDEAVARKLGEGVGGPVAVDEHGGREHAGVGHVVVHRNHAAHRLPRGV